MRFRIAHLALLLVPALAGCYSYSPLTVGVRDRATREPIEGATVRVSNTSLLNPVKPDGAESVTDASGEVRLRVASYNRLLIRVIVPGRADTLVNADHPADWGQTEWFSPAVDEDGRRASVEVRIGP